MPDTPGERAYTAWFQAAGLTHLVDWTQLRPDAQACWEAAAQAVHVAPLFRFALGQPVQVQGDAALYTIHSRGCESTARGRDLVWYRLTRDGAVLETVGDDVLRPAGPPAQEDTHA